MQIPGRFVGNGLDRSVRFTRYIVISGWLQRAAYMPPLRSTRNVVIAINPRDAAVSFQCARAAGTPDLLFIIYYLLFNPSHPPGFRKQSPLSYPFRPIFARFCSIWSKCTLHAKKYVQHSKKNPFTNGVIFWYNKAMQKRFSTGAPGAKFGRICKKAWACAGPPHGLQITLMKTEEEKCPEQNSLWMATPRLRM